MAPEPRNQVNQKPATFASPLHQQGSISTSPVYFHCFLQQRSPVCTPQKPPRNDKSSLLSGALEASSSSTCLFPAVTSSDQKLGLAHPGPPVLNQRFRSFLRGFGTVGKITCGQSVRLGIKPRKHHLHDSQVLRASRLSIKWSKN